MINLLETGMAWLSDQLDQYVATDGLYRADAGEVTIPMSVGQTETSRATNEGIVTETIVTDVMFAAAKLIIAAQQREPEPGDEIEVTLGGVTRKLEVASPGGDVPAWRFCDPWKIRIRVHVTEVADV